MTVSVGDGVSLTLVQPSVYRGTSAPSAGVQVGDLWVDTSTNPPVVKQCNSISPITWVAVDSGGGGGGDGYNLLVVNGGAASLSTTLTLSNSNNVSFGIAGGVITATATFAGGGGGGIAVAAGTQTATTNTVVFANSNGISFGMSGSSQVTASYTVPTVSTAPSAIVGSNATYTSGSVVFTGSNAVTVRSTTGQQIVIDAPVQTVQTQNLVSVQGSTGNISFNNSNGITFGFNASTITASHNGLTSQSNQAFSAAGGSSAFQTLNFVDSNGVSFTNTNGSVGATVRTDYASSNHSHGNPTLALTNLTGTTASNSNGFTLSLSAAAGGGGADGYNILSAGTQLANTNTTVVFANSNGISFGMSGSSQITASYTVPTQTVQTQNMVSVQGSTGNISFSNSNGITFGFNASTITASHNGITSQTVQTQSNVQGISAGTQVGRTGDIVFVNSNGISFGLSNSSQLTASYTVPSTAGLLSAVNISAGTTSNNLSAATFSNSNGLSFGLNGSVITGSHNGLTTARASNDGVGLNTAQTNVTWTVNSAGISLNAGGYAGTTTGFAGNLISGSITNNTAGLNVSLNHPAWLTTAALSNHSHGNPSLNLTNLSGTTASNSAGFTLSLSAAAPGGGVTPVASASNGSFSFTTLAFSNANNVTFGTSAGSIITASVAAGGGGGAESNWFNLVGANTAGNTTASGSTIGLSGIGLTLSGTNNSNIVISAPPVSSLVGAGGISLSTAGSTITISYTGAGGGGGFTEQGFNPYPDYVLVAGQVGQGTLQFDPERFPNFTCDRVGFPIVNTNSSNSSGSHTLSYWVGIYTRTSNSLSLLTSTSASRALTHSGTVGSYSLYSGMRLDTIGFSTSFSEGQYWLAYLSRTTSGGTNGTYSNMLVSNVNSNFVGFFNSAHNTTQQFTLGQGVYTATTSGLPGSVAFSQIQGSNSQALRAAPVYFFNSTV